MSETMPVSAGSNRNIILFFSSKFASVLGSSMYTFVVGLYILKLTGSGSSFAITLLCGLLPSVLMSPFAGVVADMVNRRLLLIGSDAASVLIMLLSFLAVSAQGMSLLPLYISLILLSVCSTFYSISVSSSMMMLVDPDSIQRAGSLNQIAGSVGHLLAPILAGMLYAFLPLKDFMLLNAAGFAVSTVMGCMLRFKPVSRSDASAGAAEAPDNPPFKERLSSVTAEVRTNLKEGFSYVLRRPVIRSLLIIVFWINFFVVALNVVLPYVTVQTMGLTSKQYGVLEAMIAGGMLLMSLLLTLLSQSKDPVKPIIGGLSALGLLFLAMAVPLLLHFTATFTFFFFLPLLLLVGVVIMIINIPIQVYLQQTIEEEYRGRVFGLVEGIAGSIAPLGMLLYGVLLDWIPGSVILLVSGSAILAVTFIGRRGLMSSSAAEKQSVQTEVKAEQAGA
ncbi:MFS transporter [Paenibacillus sp. MMS20-IR301]|uniref:MFS transporter n=1 Tax=Paenibacillus sp. MMS20-IR301 TaxID=2895946 RepID=UPI0028E96889|nr:MFS transporter [Paenibacillus sp. MMS20-IR301]WNS44162.1 MFS transporter [Paenibacillus sp. MMS20-IR301]